MWVLLVLWGANDCVVLVMAVWGAHDALWGVIDDLWGLEDGGKGRLPCRPQSGLTCSQDWQGTLSSG